VSSNAIIYNCRKNKNLTNKYITNKISLQKILKGILHLENKDKNKQENTRKNESH
jgi:hypothetical protein